MHAAFPKNVFLKLSEFCLSQNCRPKVLCGPPRPNITKSGFKGVTNVLDVYLSIFSDHSIDTFGLRLLTMAMIQLSFTIDI